MLCCSSGLILLLAFSCHGILAFRPAGPMPGRSMSILKGLSINNSGEWDGESQLSRRQVLAGSFTAAASGLLLPKDAIANAQSAPPVQMGTVPTIRLGGGNSSLRVSRTIQGYWQLAGGHGSYREVDAIENMKAHYDAGITTLDTADIYGPSELIVGKFVNSQPGAIPCTKFCCFRYLEVSFVDS